MNPLPEDEQAENSAYGSELDDKEKVGADPAEVAQRRAGMRDNAVQGGGEGDGTPRGNLQTAGGPSGDAAAAGRSKKSGAGSGLMPGSGSSSSSEGGNLASAMAGIAKKRKRRRLLLGGGIATAMAALPIIFFIVSLPLELVHIEENITQYFDKRMQHTIQSRVGSGWKAVIDENGEVQGFRKNTGNPLQDAYANVKINSLESDLNVKPEFSSSGKLTGFRDIASGEHYDLSDASLSDRRSAVRGLLSDRYPELGFFRLNIRARAIDGAWGIKRKFLEDTREKVTDTQASILEKIKQQFTGREENTDGASESESSDEKSAQDDLGNAVAADAGNAEGTSATAELGTLAPGGKFVVQDCGLSSLGSSVNKDLNIAREGQLMRIAFVVLSTADQLKRGDLHSNQLSVFMRLLSNFAKAPGWEKLFVSSKTKLTDQSKYSANGGSELASIAGTASHTPIPGSVCSVINDPVLGPIAIAGVDGLQGILAAATDGLSAALESAGDAALDGVSNIPASLAFGEAAKVVVDAATQAASKPILDISTATGGDIIDATMSGYDNYANINARSNGGEELSAGQVATLDSEADNDDIQSAQQKGIAYALFSPNYDRSLTSSLILRTPTSTDQITSGFNSAIAVISEPFSKTQLASIGAFIARGTPFAEADNVASSSEDPSGWGVPQMGIPDDLLAKYPDPEANEQWVMNYLCSKGQTLYDGYICGGHGFGNGGDSSGELTDQNNSHDDDYHQFVRDCLINQDANQYLSNSECTDENNTTYQRFRVYRLDLGIANYITSYNNSQDDQNPNGGSSPGSSGTSSPGGSSTPSGSAQQLAQELLDAAHAGKITLAVVNAANQSDGSTAEQNLQETLQGQPANTSTTCLGGGTAATNKTTPLSAVLLQFILDVNSQTNLTIDELAGGCHVADSNHYKGIAVDFGCPFNATIADDVGKQFNISDGTGETCSSGAGHYHYSIGGN